MFHLCCDAPTVRLLAAINQPLLWCTPPAGRWPDDPLAFSKTKAALGIQLAGSLETGYGHRTVATEEHVDVLMEGFAFRWVLGRGWDGREEGTPSLCISSLHPTLLLLPSFIPYPSPHSPSPPLALPPGCSSTAGGTRPC